MDSEVSEKLSVCIKVQGASSCLLVICEMSLTAVMLISSTAQEPAADLSAAAAAPQHGGHPALLPAGAFLRPPQHAPAPHHEAR